MSEYMVQASSIIPIADAIREKTGVTDTITLAEMPELIRGIKTGGFPNGTEWTQSNINSGGYSNINYCHGVWFVGSNTQFTACRSDDGMVWTAYNDSNYINDVIYVDNAWFAGTRYGVYRSVDSITWTQCGTLSGCVYKIIYLNGVWVAGTNTYLYYSTDCETWSEIRDIENVQIFIEVGGLLVAGSKTSGYGVWYSTDGISWTKSNVDVTPMAIRYADGLWVMATDGGLWYSNDGKNWFQYDFNTSNVFKDVCYGNGIWVTICDSSTTGGIFRSEDGKNWTRVSDTAPFGILYSVTWANGVWVVTTYSKGYHYSFDGITWAKSDYSNEDVGSYTRPVNANGIWVGVSRGNGILYSLTWAPPT